jgi:long-subunit acyl-CoA synthetase (AMP-forming)
MLIEVLKNHASEKRMEIALQGSEKVLGDIQLNYQQLFDEISSLQSEFNQQIKKSAPVLALALDNHPAWMIVDLTAIVCHIPLVPLPLFFSNTQILHAITDAGASCLICDNPQHFSTILGDSVTGQSTLNVAGKTVTLLHLNIPAKKLPKDTAKITYTSGTTGAPKGVCLSRQAMLSVANAIKTATQLSPNDAHLCVLPLSTLLENVAGVYAVLLAGATAHILPSAQVGLNGNNLNIQQLCNTLANSKANTAILIPQLLSALVGACEAGVKLPDLRFVAVGGAHVAIPLLQRAAALQLPIFEGYGLSESASVVALNTPAANKIGSAGKPLPHIEIAFSDENEILVKGANLLGYTGDIEVDAIDTYIKTGDIGYLDADGFLFINGRKKNIFITSFGRNVSPEWVERELTSCNEILQACLFGEAKPWNTAIIVPSEHATFAQIEVAITSINTNLPDYARVTEWLPAFAPFSIQNQQLTANGRLKRDAIWQAYQQQINVLYALSTV